MTPEGQAIGDFAEKVFGGVKVASNKALLEQLDGPDMRAWFVDALRDVIQRDGLTFAERNLISRITGRALEMILREAGKT